MNNNTQTEENILDAEIRVNKIPLKTTRYYKLDKKLDWTKALILELNKNSEDKNPEELITNSDPNIELEVIKKFKPEYGEYLLIKGHLSAAYTTRCVRTLKEMNDSIELELQLSFLDAALEKDDAFIDQMDFYDKEEIYELYFYEKGIVEIARIIREQISLNLNEYPVLDADAPLPWGNEAPETKQ